MFALKPIYLCAALLFFTIASASSHTELDSRSGCTDSDKLAKGQLLTQEKALEDDVFVQAINCKVDGLNNDFVKKGCDPTRSKFRTSSHNCKINFSGDAYYCESGGTRVCLSKAQMASAGMENGWCFR
ncbi:uncharacterized protein STEHIDRAFT_107467 [Stereum hirsutum FP-91666 SS1]|uniref:uncharacterized protein n=1 Tax=Stereum hirsutum (strain FP-91666) TaxID=721885 RepID=UPI000440E955|nr:uncharacterized protein STEHIDRAFT_107467 [Stereum hirsutum FP-91666 SS1]EIM90716.1 hypothetical protein STEHIDRAFT_107467 [Stereum hirsutum FP-91666 SS1]